jgi:hypothetical protein
MEVWNRWFELEHDLLQPSYYAANPPGKEGTDAGSNTHEEDTGAHNHRPLLACVPRVPFTTYFRYSEKIKTGVQWTMDLEVTFQGESWSIQAVKILAVRFGDVAAC